MIGDIRRHLLLVSFLPFTIHMADGRHLEVPTLDHITVGPSRAYLINDDNSSEVLSGLLMADLTIHAPAKFNPAAST